MTIPAELWPIVTALVTSGGVVGLAKLWANRKAASAQAILTHAKAEGIGVGNVISAVEAYQRWIAPLEKQNKDQEERIVAQESRIAGLEQELASLEEAHHECESRNADLMRRISVLENGTGPRV